MPRAPHQSETNTVVERLEAMIDVLRTRQRSAMADEAADIQRRIDDITYQMAMAYTNVPRAGRYSSP